MHLRARAYSVGPVVVQAAAGCMACGSRVKVAPHGVEGEFSGRRPSRKFSRSLDATVKR